MIFDHFITRLRNRAAKFTLFIFAFSVFSQSIWLTQNSYAAISELPAPDKVLVQSSTVSSPVLRGLRLDPTNPLNIDFVVDTGDQKAINKEEASRLIRYFIAGLTVAEEDVWVNLSPYEEDRVTSDSLLNAELGDELLEQDYILKQLSSSVTYPESETGKKFWASAREKMADMGIVGDLPMDTFNKIWISPKTAEIYEDGTTALINEASLKAMLEKDYLAAQNNSATVNGDQVSQITASLMRDIVVPEVEKAVNQSAEFAKLRQIYHSLVLASWFKQRFNDSFFSMYIDSGNTKGVNSKDAGLKDQIFGLYVDAFKKGVYNYVKKEYDPTVNRKVKRAYFSGGVEVQSSAVMNFNPDANNARAKFADANLQIIDSDAVLTEEESINVVSSAVISFPINRNPVPLSATSVENTIIPNVTKSFEIIKERMMIHDLYTADVQANEEIIQKRVFDALTAIKERLNNNEINVNATASEGGNFAYFASAANPLQWAHIVFMLESIAYHGADKVIMVPQGLDERKPDIIDPAIRHPFNEHLLNTLFPGLIEYSDIALGNKDDGETNVYKQMRRFPEKNYDINYMVGTDHNNLYVTSSRPDDFKIDTIGKFMEKGRKHDVRVENAGMAQEQKASPSMLKRYGEHYQEIKNNPEDGDFDGVGIKYLEPFPVVVSATRIRNGFKGTDVEALVFLPVADIDYYNLLEKTYSQAGAKAASMKPQGYLAKTIVNTSDVVLKTHELVKTFREGKLFKTPVLDQVGAETETRKPLEVRFDGEKQLVRDFFTLNLDVKSSPNMTIKQMLLKHDEIMQDKNPISFKSKLDAELIEGIFSAYAYELLDEKLEKGQRNIEIQFSGMAPKLVVSQTKAVAKKLVGQWNAKNEDDPISIEVTTESSAVVVGEQLNNVFKMLENSTDNSGNLLVHPKLLAIGSDLSKVPAHQVDDVLAQWNTAIDTIFNIQKANQVSLDENTVQALVKFKGHINRYLMTLLQGKNSTNQIYEYLQSGFNSIDVTAFAEDKPVDTVREIAARLANDLSQGLEEEGMDLSYSPYRYSVPKLRYALYEIAKNYAHGEIDIKARVNAINDEELFGDQANTDAVKESQKQVPARNREKTRIGVLPMAGDPLQWAHLSMGLLAIAENKLDKVIYVIAGDDARKPFLPSKEHRHGKMATDIFDMFGDLFQYSNMSVNTSLDGEFTIFRILENNRNMDIEAMYMLGGDHKYFLNPKGKADTAAKLVTVINEGFIYQQNLEDGSVKLKSKFEEDADGNQTIWTKGQVEADNEVEVNLADNHAVGVIFFDREEKGALVGNPRILDEIEEKQADKAVKLLEADVKAPMTYPAAATMVRNAIAAKYMGQVYDKASIALATSASSRYIKNNSVYRGPSVLKDYISFFLGNERLVPDELKPIYANLMENYKNFTELEQEEVIPAVIKWNSFWNAWKLSAAAVAYSNHSLIVGANKMEAWLEETRDSQEAVMSSSVEYGGIDMKLASSSLSTADGSTKIVLPKIDLEGVKGLTFKVVSIDSIDTIDEFMTYAWAK